MRRFSIVIPHLYFAIVSKYVPTLLHYGCAVLSERRKASSCEIYVPISGAKLREMYSMERDLKIRERKD